ncbi:hypothetical protein LEN26_009461 [Aphanomyces euteiches]|nr:hypothetical protein LEN26_009461 [Aphanomyces euteiches]
MDAEVARLKAELTAKDETLNQLKVKAKAFAEAMTNEKKGLEGQLTQAKNEMNDLKTKAKAFADNVKAQILAEKERVQVLEKQLQEARAATPVATQAESPSVDKAAIEHQFRAQSEAQLAEMRQSIQRLSEESNGRMNQVVAALQSMTQSASSDVTQLLNDVQVVVNAKLALERQVSTLESDKQLARTNSASLADKLRSEMIAIEAECAKLRSQESTLRMEIGQAQQRARELEAELAREKMSNSSQTDGLQDTVRKLESELSQERMNHQNQVQDQVRKLESELAEERSSRQNQVQGALQEWQAKEAAWAAEKKDIVQKHEKFLKEEEEKKQKVKAYVAALTAEKQKALEDVDKQLKERDALHEKRMAEVKAKTMAKFTEHESVIKKGQEELEALRQLMASTTQKYEAEIKMLQTKKKEAEEETMEILKKKRLAAKAETQKLANDLEGIQKRAAMLVDVTGNKCSHQAKQLEVLQERVLEAIHVVSHQKKCDISNLNELSQVVTSPRMNAANLPGPAIGLNKIDEDVSHVIDQMTALSNVTERLVDLTLEDSDLSLKEIVLDRMKKQFSACFVHQYTKSDEAGLLRQRSSSATAPESPS